MDRYTERFLKKTCFRMDTTSELTQRFTFQHDNEPKLAAKTMLKRISDFPCVAQPKPRLKTHGTSVKRTERTKLKRICKEEWDTLPRSRCAKLVETCPKDLQL